MKPSFVPVAAALALAGSVAAQFTINTPLDVIVCQPTLIAWADGTPPFFLNQALIYFSSVLPANRPNATPLLDFGEVSGHELTWVVNITAGTSGFFNLRDSAGFIAQSDTFTVQRSRDTSCLRK
ncbi:hypothetical protein D9619_005060 [Psilocybe cf. subviscida]|uniref:Uncharacterized protein n=1 Tax=Psilocybe cf. subviscida TaxID=2480587 RepID=A0A8H5BPQ6_9AGAR|nr:hypothetical protein D9619_005060 [Psilocybe cf. subviscida]